MFIKLVCQICGNEFERTVGEVKRNAKIGRNVFCTRRCAGKYNAKNIPMEKRGVWKHLNAANRYDEYSMFRVFMHRIVSKKKNIDLTLQDLKEQWEKQNGICPYTGWLLESPKNTGDKRSKKLNTASLDRIDSTKGYVKGNVEYVSLMAQFAKNDFSKQDLLNFCKAVASYMSYG